MGPIEILTSFLRAHLQATAFAAHLSSPRCFDDEMFKRLADAIAALEIRLELCIVVGLGFSR